MFWFVLWLGAYSICRALSEVVTISGYLLCLSAYYICRRHDRCARVFQHHVHIAPMFAVQIIGIVTGFELASNVGMVLRC